VFEMRRLRIDQQPRGGGEGRPFGGVGQTRDAERTADPDRAAEDAGSELRQADQLAGAAGEDHATTRLGSKPRPGEPVADHFGNLLDTRLDDSGQDRTRDELWRLTLFAPNGLNRDHVALVRASGQHTAIKRLDSLGVVNTCRESAREIHGDVVAAESESIDVD